MSTEVSIAVLGSSRATEHGPDYRNALAIGLEIARRGGRVVCGGGGGVMEAACRGAAEAGGSSLGVLVEGGGEANRYVRDIAREPDLSGRLRRLRAESAAAIFLPRGLGTMLELTWMAESIAKAIVPPRPLVFLGTFWRRAVALAVAEAAGPGAENLAASIRFVPTPEGAVRAAFGEGAPAES